jgi:Tfp pilus assembly protein PilF
MKKKRQKKPERSVKSFFLAMTILKHDKRRALRYLKKVDKDSEYYNEAQYQLGLNYLKKSPRKAARYLMNITHRSRNYDSAHFKIGEIYRHIDPPLAASHYLNISRSSVCYTDAQYSLGMIYLSDSNFSRAKKHLSNVARDSDKYPESLLAIGKVADFQGDQKKALAHYRKVQKGTPQYMEAQLRMIKIYQDSAFERSEKHIRNLSKTEVAYGRSMFNLGLLYMKRGIRKKRESDRKKAVRLWTSLSRHRRIGFMAGFYAKAAARDSAYLRQFIRKRILAQEYEGEILRSLMQPYALFSLGKYSEAESLLEERAKKNNLSNQTKRLIYLIRLIRLYTKKDHDEIEKVQDLAWLNLFDIEIPINENLLEGLRQDQ